MQEARHDAKMPAVAEAAWIPGASHSSFRALQAVLARGNFACRSCRDGRNGVTFVGAMCRRPGT